MDDREKLIQVLKESITKKDVMLKVISGSCTIDSIWIDLEKVADRLIAKGTTFRAVVPGHENNYNIAEMSYNNGYAKGLEDGKPKWIPVAERLPDVGKDVLMYFKNEGGTTVSGYFAYMDEENPIWNAYTDGGWYTDCENKPTHWMPLPEPPKEDCK